MQTISIIPDNKNGRFFFELPENLKNREIVIQIILKEPQKAAADINEEAISLVRSFAGIGKETDLSLSPEQWYLQ